VIPYWKSCLFIAVVVCVTTAVTILAVR